MRTIQEVMTPNPVVIRADRSVWEALERLEDCEVRHLPVVSRDGMLIGMVSDRDLAPWRQALRDLRAGEASGAALAALDRPVSERMSALVLTVEDTDTVDRAITVMCGHHVGAVPVVEVGTRRLAGIVSYEDLLGLLSQILEEPVFG